MIELEFSSVDYGEVCDCDERLEAERVPDCRLTFSIINKSHVLKEFPWVVYVVLAELFMR